MNAGTELDVSVVGAVFADAPFGVALLDTQARFLRVNGVFASANGLPPEEHLGRSVRDVLGDGAEEVCSLAAEVVDTRRVPPVHDLAVVDGAGTPRRWRTWWIAALRADGDLLGVLVVGLDTTAQYNAELARAAAEQRLRLVAASAALLDAGLDAGEISRRMVSLLVPDVAAWACVHLVADGGAISFAAARHRDPQQSERLARVFQRFPVDRSGPYGAAVASGETQVPPEVLAAVAPDDPEFVATMGELVIGSAVVVPLTGRDGVIGAVTIARGSAPDDSFAADLEGLADVVARAALALDNALLYGRQAGIALTLQRALLPSLVGPFKGVRVAGRYIPGVAGLEVGGDFYDVLQLRDGLIALVVGDVMGRGLQAAAVMGQLRAAIRTLVHASAGHLPPALRDPGGDVRLIGGPVGPPLGTGLWVHESTEHPLPVGAALVLCTDGLVEDREQDIDRGMEHLCRAFSAAGSEPQEIADGVLRAMGREQGHDDDVALLAVVVDG